MTTARDAKRLVRPLLERHDDLSMVGAFLIVPPVRHFIRAVLIGRLGSREWFRPVAASNFLFECHFNFTFHHDDYLYPKSKEMRWRLDPYARQVTNSSGNSVVLDPAFDWGPSEFQMPSSESM